MRTTIITAAVLPIFFLASCMAPHNEPPIQDLMRQHREKKNPPPEEVWNSTGVWVKVSAEPPIYIPNGYPLKAPRTEAAGEWFEDKRDGKRLFVPANGVAVWSESILRVEAIKATTVRKSKIEFESPWDNFWRQYGAWQSRTRHRTPIHYRVLS